MPPKNLQHRGGYIHGKLEQHKNPILGNAGTGSFFLLIMVCIARNVPSQAVHNPAAAGRVKPG
ncbi:MAG: hypothetical protein A3H64_02700 [Candidatus Ryanbacteria bacterium RIFCSPLOWO2_02_FULL_45_11c]|uniref:Uncharacterized protein n=1 Tax=Candidatus Ryanbacteria bacterium RIFCSPLOWO2_02_FULL_45_11c TaxID=1802128 RepID=A0A1G2H2S2_9BACT|nr:MAG: hypothetical protein A3H64_02700 [Candidatus Ryanbacteria bacterium RIFCSPLOWO2_02_FULL_45_11c]